MYQLNFKPNNNKLIGLNTLVHVHDLQCNCEDPLEHTTHLIFKQEKNLRLWETTKNLIKK